MNDRSSRSHSIFRVKICSREKTLAEMEGREETPEEAEQDKGAIRESFLNLVGQILRFLCAHG